MDFGMVMELAMTLAAGGLGLFAILRLRREGRPALAGLGLAWRPPALADLAAGALIAGLAMAGVALVEQALGAVSLAAGGGPGRLAGQAAGMLVHALLEEVLTRAFLLTGLVLLLGGRRGPAVLISALVFGLMHAGNPAASPLSVLGNALGGLVYAVAFLGSGAIWLPLGLHFAWNFVQGPVIGFPVSGLSAHGLWQVLDHGPGWLSGGAYGPEAGAVGIAARFVVLAAVVGWLARRPAAAAAGADPGQGAPGPAA